MDKFCEEVLKEMWREEKEILDAIEATSVADLFNEVAK